jgi:MFS family permease
VFFLLVLQLQTVAGFSPLAAGTALLPLTVIMLLFSARSGALAGRIGPRLQLVVGPLVSAVGLLLLLRVGPDAPWLGHVLPAIVVFGLGLTATVAPLTSTVLDAAPDRFAGSASGVNNAVARAAGLLAVAVIPGVAGITGADYARADAFDSGFRIAVVVSAGLLVLAALVSLAFVRRRPARAPSEPAPDRMAIEECLHCGVTAPQLLPGPQARDER